MTSRDDATLRNQLNTLTPRLRRYARALMTGKATHSDLADDVLRATLTRALGARHVGASADLVIRLYATVTQLNREMAVSRQQIRAAGDSRRTLISTGQGSASTGDTRLSAGLLSLPLEAREALLLVGLERFDYADAARILRISRDALMCRLTQGRTTLDAALRIGSAAAYPTGTGGKARASHLRLITCDRPPE